jgi:hypothetical protein
MHAAGTIHTIHVPDTLTSAEPCIEHSPLAEAEGPTEATDTGVRMRLAGGSWPFTEPFSAVMLQGADRSTQGIQNERGNNCAGPGRAGLGRNKASAAVP